jgi:undecaprenyl-diphosphatase
VIPRISPAWLDQLVSWDQACLRRLHRAADYRCILWSLQAVSRLADGVFWYALIVAVALVAGERGLKCAIHMVLTGAAGVVIVRLLKHRTARLRPFQRLEGLRVHARPIDPFSFPSGHALHAVAFTAVATAYFPGLALALVPFMLLVALSRVALGLHYPSDVLAGVALGITVALAGLAV